MARSATAPELALFRSPGQWSKVRAAILVPSTIYTARINQTFTTRDKVLEITYDTGSGTLSDVREGMTVYFGTTAGAWNRGIARVRSIDASKVYIGETADINFQDNDYITIVDDFGLWARPILISGGVPYMDGGVAYSDQHTNFLPFIRGGPDRVIRKTGSSVSASFNFPAFVPSSSVSSRSTAAPGSASITGGTTQTPSISWDSVGWKTVYHTVTGANGKSFFIVRKVFIWDETNTPEPVEWETLRGDVEAGGWELALSLYGSANLSQVRDGAKIIVFTEDRYGATKTEIGPVSGAANILFNGWIAGESIRWGSQGGSVSFRAYTAHYFLQKIPSWPSGVEFTSITPAGWTQIKNLTIDLGVVHHFLQWRSTAPRILDIFLSGDTKLTKEISSLASDLWSQIREMSFEQIFARPLVNCLGQLSIEVHPQLIPAASRTHPTVITLTKEDIEDGHTIERRVMDEVSIVDLSGVSINSSGRATAYFALSPGHSHSHYGNPVIVNRLLLESQADANQKAGLYRGWLNNPYPSMSLRLAGNLRLVDIAPLQKCELSIASGDTVRGISESLGLIPLSVEVRFEPESGYLYQEVTFEAETFEDLSVIGDTPGSGEVSFPPLPPLPPLPPFEPLSPVVSVPGDEEGVTTRVLLHDTNLGLLYTEDFDSSSPTWLPVNSGLTEPQYKKVNVIVLTPSGEIYIANRGDTGFDADIFIAYAPAIGQTFQILEDATTIAAKYGFPSGGQAVNALGVNPLTGQVAYVIASTGVFPSMDFGKNVYIGSGASFSQGADLAAALPSLAPPASLTFGGGKWRLIGTPNNVNPRFVRISGDGSTLEAQEDMPGQLEIEASSYHVPVTTTGTILNFQDGGLLRITANGSNVGDFTSPIGSDLNNVNDNRMATDPTGTQILTSWDVSGRRGRSNDGGASWVGIPNLPFGNDYAYAWAGGAGAESRWVAARGIVRYSPDFGETWLNREGNLLTIAPIPSIDIVKVIF